MNHSVLTFDFGASSGRAMLGKFDGEKISLTEVHRFDNNPVMMHGTFYWDLPALFREIKQGISKAHAIGNFVSIGIDTWGVDFGLLDKNGDLLQNPVHYRDVRTAGMIKKACEKIEKDRLYQITGIQLMELNTLFQLYALSQKNPELLERADCALLMPDLFGYLLTGKKTAEYSIASTTQMLDPATKNWNRELIKTLGLPTSLFPDVVPSGTNLGKVSKSICEETGIDQATVISTAGHDTACAVFAAPTVEDDFIFISCGTWSLVGTELKAPIINRASMECNLTNEGGYDGTTTFLKNITGLWLIQETRRQFKREGKEYSYNDLEKEAIASPEFQYFIDPDAPEFSTPGDLPERIRLFCERTNQGRPQTVGEIMRCIYESLAMKYRYAFDQIKSCTQKSYHFIHMLGGGTKDTLLCRMTANSTGCRIIAGPIEATAIGNTAIQLISSGVIAGMKEARKIISNSFQPIQYEPHDYENWNKAYARFCTIVRN